jgi:hypothetical protein
MARNGIEPCEKSMREGVECMCGILPEGLPELETDEGMKSAARCRLCTGRSDHYLYGMKRYGQKWTVEVCGICGVVCDEL